MSPKPTAGETPSSLRLAVPLAGYYALYYAAIGILLPFLPAYLKSLELSATEVGVLLAIGPSFTLLSPPLWGHLADRTRRPDRVLSILSLGAFLGFLPLLVAQSFVPLVATLAAYAFFAASITTIVDSLTLQKVAVRGGTYSRLRMFGSAGFVASSAAFGLAVEEIGREAVAVPLALMAGYFLWSFTVRLPAPALDGAALPSPWSGLRLLRRRKLSWFLAATCLQWVASAPFHGLFSIHVRALGLSPAVVGLSAGLGVVTEIAVFAAYPRVADRIAPRHLVAVSCLVSVVRWAGMAMTSRPEVMVALSLLHGLTFGAFFVASIAYISRRVPPSLRATGQGLFVSITFGLGGLIGFSASGVVYDLLGGHGLFAAAAALAVVPAVIALSLPAPRAVPEEGQT